MRVSPERFDDVEETDHVPGLPFSRAVGFDPEAWEGVEWARAIGLEACWRRPHDVEGASFVDVGERCWILGMKGAQPLHSDRHMLRVAPDQQGHCWNAVVEADGDQMLLVKETLHGYRHHPLRVGALVYFNTYQPHLVSRDGAQDSCVIVQVGGIGPDNPESAVAAMRAALERRTVVRRDRTDA
jgi:hypothetical protein